MTQSPLPCLPEMLEELLVGVKSQTLISDQAAGGWWKQQWDKQSLQSLAGNNARSLQLVSLAFDAPNFSCAFVAAYQIALRTLFADLPDHGDLACLCISEKAGNSPKAIETVLKQGEVNGEKTFVTCAMDIDTLLLMIDDQQAKPARSDGRKNLLLIQLDEVQKLRGDTLTISSGPVKSDQFLPDIGKGRLKLAGFPVSKARQLPGDAQQSYSKPFSIMEGLCIRLAMCAHLLKWSRVYKWPEALQGDLILQILALESCYSASPLSPLTQIAIDAQNRAMEGLVRTIDELAELDAEFQRHWQRDKICLFMDFRLRPMRLEAAWQQLLTNA